MFILLFLRLSFKLPLAFCAEATFFSDVSVHLTNDVSSSSQRRALYDPKKYTGLKAFSLTNRGENKLQKKKSSLFMVSRPSGRADTAT